MLKLQTSDYLLLISMCSNLLLYLQFQGKNSLVSVSCTCVIQNCTVAEISGKALQSSTFKVFVSEEGLVII